jgi:hypothetical protein
MMRELIRDRNREGTDRTMLAKGAIVLALVAGSLCVASADVALAQSYDSNSGALPVQAPVEISGEPTRAGMSRPEVVAREYFVRMQARDLSVVDLFDDDAVLRGLGDRIEGKPGLRDFYREAIENRGPEPDHLILISEGSRVAAEIEIRLLDGQTAHAIDLFEIEDGQIRTLTCFTADHPAASPSRIRPSM